jgi:hypothetical protein
MVDETFGCLNNWGLGELGGGTILHRLESSTALVPDRLELRTKNRKSDDSVEWKIC